MRYLKIFENFSDSQVVQDLWKVNTEDNLHLVISCMEETGLEDLDFEIYYGIIETVTKSRAPGLPSYGSKHWRSGFVHNNKGLIPDLINGHLDMKYHNSIIKRLRKGPLENFIPVIEVIINGLNEDNDEQITQFSSIYTERFRDYFSAVYNVEECEWDDDESYSVRLHMNI
jgi:hypothetical protein